MTLHEIASVVERETGRSPEEIASKIRRRNYVFARYLFIFIASHFGYSASEIARFLNKDHTTILHALIRAEKMPLLKEMAENVGAKGKIKSPIITGISQQNQKKFGKIYERFGGRCFVCGFSSCVEICHIKPRYLGGSDEMDNLLLLCPNHHSMFDSGLLVLKDIHIPISYPHP